AVVNPVGENARRRKKNDANSAHIAPTARRAKRGVGTSGIPTAASIKCPRKCRDLRASLERCETKAGNPITTGSKASHTATPKTAAGREARKNRLAPIDVNSAQKSSSRSNRFRSATWARSSSRTKTQRPSSPSRPGVINPSAKPPKSARNDWRRCPLPAAAIKQCHLYARRKSKTSNEKSARNRLPI